MLWAFVKTPATNNELTAYDKGYADWRKQQKREWRENMERVKDQDLAEKLELFKMIKG